jgi:glucose-1-phosphate adenylyltransferase
MGIYFFSTDILIELLQGNPHFDDFGGDIIPHAIQHCSVYGFDFDGYWRDIGTIRSFYETNLELASPEPPFNFYDVQNPIYTHSRFLPGSIVKGGRMQNVLLAEGCQIEDCEITHSVVGVRSVIAAGTRIRESVLMGADYYAAEIPSIPPIGIGPGCDIEGAIIDKNARVGENVVIRPFPRGMDLTEENWVVQDGIVVVPKDAVILPGTRIEPSS